MANMNVRRCGCVRFDYGPPVLCEKHQSKVEKKIEREQVREEKGLRKIVAQQALEHGHDLSPFQEYASYDGKWTAHCHACGALVIVYDRIPARGDQICGRGMFEACRRSDLVGVLSDADREKLSERLNHG